MKIVIRFCWGNLYYYWGIKLPWVKKNNQFCILWCKFYQLFLLIYSLSDSSNFRHSHIKWRCALNQLQWKKVFEWCITRKVWIVCWEYSTDNCIRLSHFLWWYFGPVLSIIIWKIIIHRPFGLDSTIRLTAITPQLVTRLHGSS